MHVHKIGVGTLCMFCALLISAQTSIDVKENVKTMSLGERTGYTIELTSSDQKDAMKAFRAWADDLQKKADVDESGKHEISVKGLTTNTFGETPVNVYFLFEEEKGKLNVTGFFDLNGTFVSSSTNPQMVENSKQFMVRFAKRIEKIAIEEELAAAQKELEKRNEEQQQLEKKQKQLNDQITECEEAIKKAKSDLEHNSNDQKSKKEEIGKHDESVKEIQKRLKAYEGN